MHFFIFLRIELDKLLCAREKKNVFNLQKTNLVNSEIVFLSPLSVSKCIFLSTDDFFLSLKTNSRISGIEEERLFQGRPLIQRGGKSDYQ